LNTKEQILYKFYELHEKPSIIAKELLVVPSYVTKIVKQDICKYDLEKEYQAKISKEKRKTYKNEWNKNNKKSEELKKLDAFVKEQHIQASKELSYVPTLSDVVYRKWNPNAYHTTKLGNIVIDRKLNVGIDVPKRINTKVTLPTQKYKKKYCFSY
jgi:hypothetical protein